MSLCNVENPKKAAFVATIFTLVVLIVASAWLGFSSYSERRAVSEIAEFTEKEVATWSPERQQLVRSTPQNLQVSKPNQPYPTTTVLGLTFQSPWGEGEAVEHDASFAHISFSNGLTMLVSVDKQDATTIQESLRELDDSFSGSDIKTLTLFQAEMGKDFTEYDYFNYLLESTPKTIRNSTSVQAARAHSRALILRTTSGRAGAEHAYRFATETVKGFQFETPETAESVAIYLWDKRGQGYALVLHTEDVQEISQKDIGVVISTVRPAG